MALKNLFDMVKADRYTADGREALIKAQEAETEDKVYQIGEISQKTGLQKTANGWVKPKNGKQPGAKKPDESARIAASKEARAKKSQELGQKAAGDFAKYKDLPPVQRKDALGAASHEGISIGMTQRSMEGMGWDLIQADDKVNVYGKPDGSKAIMKHDGKKITEVSYEGPGSKTAAKEPGPDRDDSPERAAYERELSRQQAQRAADDPRGFGYEEPPMEPAAPRREAVSAGRMMKDLDGNFWSRPEDFKEDITSRGWDVDEMTNEYAVISNEAGSQYEVRFDDHSDDGDLTVRNFKALQIDEDDDDDSLEDAAPSLSEIVDRVYNIGEISEKTGLQKTAQGWKPPKETKFGKVKQNKEGQWGVQTKQGKGSDFLKHKSEKEASRALANYTAGYNTTARSKEDPHSDKARQVKQWRKEDEKAAKARRAEGRAEHAAQFQNQPALSQTDGKGNKVEIKITESKGGGFYVDKYVNGKKVGINNANTKESAEAKAKSMMEQHMADPDYKAESKPAAQEEIGKFYTKFKDAQGAYDAGRQTFPEGGYKIYNTPQGYKVVDDPKTQQRMEAAGYEIEADVPEGTKPPKSPAEKKPAAEKKEGRNFRSELEANPKGAYDFEKTVEKSIPLSAGDKEVLGNVKSFMREEGTDYKDALKSVATGLVNGNKLHGDWYPEKEKSLLKIAKAVGMDDEVKSYVKTLAKGYDFGYSEDAAPRVLTGDCRIRIRKEKPALTGETKIRVRK